MQSKWRKRWKKLNDLLERPMAANRKSPVHGELLVPEHLFGVAGFKNLIALEPEKRLNGAFLFAAIGRSNILI